MLARSQIQALHNSVWWESNRQWAEAETYGYEDNLVGTAKHSNRLPTDSVLSPSLDMFKT